MIPRRNSAYFSSSSAVMATGLGTDERIGINFQKASATLDGCVKVWTSRVDSVATETGRLLSGLTGGGQSDHHVTRWGDILCGMYSLMLDLQAVQRRSVMRA